MSLRPDAGDIGRIQVGRSAIGAAAAEVDGDGLDSRWREDMDSRRRATIGKGAVSGRLEWFDTKERGSQMEHALESEDGWAMTAAVRWPVWRLVNLFVEGLHVESTRGARVRSGLPPRENQTVLQAALRLRW